MTHAAGDTPGDGGRRTRRRGEEVERAVLRAAVDELTEKGYGSFTMDAVAARAGTNKTAIYRRWAGRSSLAYAAYREIVERPGDLPDTGALRTDVIALLRSTADRISASPGTQILRGLLVDARSDPALMADLRTELVRTDPGSILTLLARAVARGEAKQESLNLRVATVPVALLRDEYQTRGLSSIPDDAITEIVDLVFLPLVRPHAPGP